MLSCLYFGPEERVNVILGISETAWAIEDSFHSEPHENQAYPCLLFDIWIQKTDARKLSLDLQRSVPIDRAVPSLSLEARSELIMSE